MSDMARADSPCSLFVRHLVHVIAWLARTVTAAGDVDKLAESIGGKLDSDVKQYFEQWAARDSYKKLQIA